MRLATAFPQAVLLLLAGALTGGLFGQASELQRARSLVRAGQAEKAIPIYESLVSASPDDAGLRVNLAIAQFTAKRYAAAIEQCETALELAPGRTAALLFLGASRVQLGEAAAAIEPLEKVVEARPEERNARLMLAEALLETGRSADAVVHFERLKAELADYPRVWYGLERGYSGVAEAGVKELEDGVGSPALLHSLAGGKLLDQGFHGQAFRHYRRARSEMPELYGVSEALAEIYRQTGHEEWASAMEEQASEPRCPEAELECAFAAGEFGKVVAKTSTSHSPESLYWRAMAAREIARGAHQRLGKIPRSSQYHEVMARWHEARGGHTNAIEHWREALKLKPDNRVLQHGFVVSLHGKHDYEAALPLLNKLVAREPAAFDPVFLRGTALLNMGRTEEAIPDLEKAARMRPKHAEAQGELGRAYLQAGRVREAIVHLKLSLPADEDGSRRFQLARAYRAAGETKEARRAMQDYQSYKRQAEKRQRELEEQFEIIAP